VLVGRTEEVARLTGWANEVRHGRGRAVLVEGEPGIGKSALVRTVCAEMAGQGYEVFWGAGDELGQALPLLPFLEGLRVREFTEDPRRATIVRLLRGELTVGGADLSISAAEHLLALVEKACSARPTILVVDDLQWADQPTVALWSRLARSVAQLPLLLVGVVRPVPRRDGLLALRRTVGAAGVLRLARLPEPAVAELITTLAGGTPGGRLLRLAEGAAGNPLYVAELIDALARGARLTTSEAGLVEVAGGPIPTTLSAAIADRLGFLPARVREVLNAAALLGVDFSVSDLAVLLREGIVDLAAALDEARAAGVLVEGREGLAFRHPLIRAALYDGMPVAVRTEWHRDAGRALAGAGAPVERVARQLLSACQGAGEPAEHLDEWMAGWLVDAAPILVGQAPRAAVELLRHALASSRARTTRHDLLAGRLAEALYRVGDAGEAEQVATRALTQVTDPDVLVDLHMTLTQCRGLAGRYTESLAALSEAQAVPGTSPRHRARLLVLTARTHRDLGQVDTAGRVAARALGIATESGDRWAIGWALHVLIIVSVMRGAFAEALPLFDRALAVTEQDPSLADLRMLLQINKAVALGDLDRYEEAMAVAQDVRQLSDRTGSVVRLTQAQSALGELLFDTGRWDDALAEVDVVPAELKDPAVLCCDYGIAAIIGFHRGEGVAARRHLDAVAASAEQIGSRVVGAYALARSLAAERAGNSAHALAVLLGSLAENVEEVEEIEDLLPDAVRLAVEVGDMATAGVVTARAEALTNDADVAHRAAAARYCRGLLDSDPTQLLRAAEQYREAGRPLPCAKALEAAAVAFANAGERGSARAAYTRALDVYASLSAAWDTARLQARFRAYGIRSGPHAKHRHATHGWESLTPTEAKIAGLVVQGLSNPQVAAQLFLSPRTVATHVSHILAKLGVHSRIDIAREASRRYGTSG